MNEFETRQKIEDITGKSLSSYGVVSTEIPSIVHPPY